MLGRDAREGVFSHYILVGFSSLLSAVFCLRHRTLVCSQTIIFNYCSLALKHKHSTATIFRYVGSTCHHLVNAVINKIWICHVLNYYSPFNKPQRNILCQEFSTDLRLVDQYTMPAFCPMRLKRNVLNVNLIQDYD